MGGGILPVAIHKGTVLFLFSREWIKAQEDPGKWSDFGGSKEKKESYKDTAIREGWEESSGILGSKKTIENLIKYKTLKYITTRGYRTYVVLIDYDKMLPKKFRTKFLNILETKPRLVTKHDGLYEKDMLQWVPFEDLKENLNMFRPWYKNVVKLIINTF